MRVLLVDNHDSYTYNLFQLLADVVGGAPLVLTNDDPRWDDIDLADFDAAVISPGPGHPQQQRDVGEVPRVLAAPALPVLGVCLGHQAIAHLSGAPVVRAPTPRHGHLSRVRHRATGLFAGLPQDFTAVRYHSLSVPDPLADPLTDRLTATAWAEDGVVMGLEHLTLPRWSVQFHPESIASEHGRDLVANFAALAGRARRTPPPPTARPAPRPTPTPGPVRWRTLDHAVDTEAAFARLYATSPYAFWLDSSRPEGTARFSYLGDTEPGGEVLTYRVGEGSVVVDRAGQAPQREPGTIFDALERRTAAPPHWPAVRLHRWLRRLSGL